MKKKIFFLICCFTYISTLFSQNNTVEFESGQLIVRFRNNNSKEDFINKNSSVFYIKENIVAEWNLYVLGFDTNLYDTQDLLKKYNYSDPNITYLQLNRKVSPRNAETVTPNDQFFGNQWALKNDGANGGIVGADISATLAWAKTQGGTNGRGDSIVVAVIDGEFFIDHPDLASNMWKNKAEIPNNGIDDDNNGYVDDYHGYNAFNQSGLNNVIGNAADHGTHVAGIIGAKGDNNIGISGINWNVKILPIRGSSSNEATVVRAYKYVYDLRKKYNETNGAEGAYVVITNSSFGNDRANPANYPLWCGMYDTLGSIGVLSAGATANRDFDIDQTLDVPTACPSPFLISVTNSTNRDVKIRTAGYGKNTIDLAAPGTSIYSTYIPTTFYTNLTGTSMATPYVAGTVALLYSVLCEDLAQKSIEKPDSIALLMKDYIYQNVDKLAAFENITVTGGRLNAYKPLVALETECEKIRILNEEKAKEQERIQALKDALGNEIFQFYPNPVNKENRVLNFRFIDDSENQINVVNIVDFSGKVIISKELPILGKGIHQYQFDISNLNSGSYILHFDRIGLNQTFIKKLVVY
jgi:subtilisin family serine protease